MTREFIGTCVEKSLAQHLTLKESKKIISGFKEENQPTVKETD